MKVFYLPRSCTAAIFDMDATLYTNPEYVRLQNELPVERLASLHGKSFSQMSDEVSRFRKDWARDNNGQQISLANTFAAFGVAISESVRWREELYQPERYLSKDKQLRFSLDQLAARFVLSVVTNNPVSIASRTLRALGVDDLFSTVIGLDTCGVSKPHAEPFLCAASFSGVVPEACVSIGDRYDIDIALPLELGMGGILVDGVEDVYKLPEVLLLPHA